MKPFSFRYTVLAVVLVGLTAPLAQSAPGGGPPAESGWSFTIGAGTLYAPVFPGSSDYQLLVLPNLRASYEDVFFASVQEGVGYNVIRSGGWVAGPLMGIDFGRDADGRSPFRMAGPRSTALRGFADIDTVLQAGGFLGHEFGPWSARIELLRALGEHEGTTGTLSAGYRMALGDARTSGRPPTVVSTGPRLAWGDARNNDAWFGVPPAAAVASGLPGYKAGAGITSLGWGVRVMRPIDRNWLLFALAGYERLAGDAADSPLVSGRGSADQFTFGIFVGRRI